MRYLQTTITEIRKEGPGYALLSFRGDTPISGEPGQFVMIRGDWGYDPILPRAFSLVSSGETGAVLVRDVGAGTHLLCGMKPGDSLSVLGPLGNTFDIPDKGVRAVLVAGGVGVAPLVFLAERLAQAGIETVFVYGARSAVDLSLKDEIARMCSLSAATEDGSLGEQGLVTVPLQRILSDGRPSVVCSCGPHRMLEAVTRLAVAAGVRCQVALEAPMACGLGTCKGCVVIAPDGSFRYVCSDGPVFAGEAIFGGAS
jgi:dihydroorotate dehydrogenase electron transfer subunit